MVIKTTFVFLKNNPTKDYSKQEHVKNVHGDGKKPRQLKIQKQFDDKTIKKINLFWTEKYKLAKNPRRFTTKQK